MSDPNSFPGNHTVTVGGNETITIGGGQQVSVGKKLLLVAGDEIELRVGSASLVMKKDGTIVLKGRDITIDGFGTARIKSAGEITLKGSKVLQN